MTFEYYVAIDKTGHAGVAATKRDSVEQEVADHGGRLVAVQAAHAYEARRLAERTRQDDLLH